jgi:hypothetical protein
MSMTRVAHALRVLAVVALAGCTIITGNRVRRERQLGWIRFHNDPVVVEVPSTVSRGVDFDVTVRTYGGGCVDQGDTEIMLSGPDAEVRPFDIFVVEMPDNYACTDILKRFTHRATLRFTQAGAATVRIRGRAEPGGEIIVVERQVTVQ